MLILELLPQDLDLVRHIRHPRDIVADLHLEADRRLEVGVRAVTVRGAENLEWRRLTLPVHREAHRVPARGGDRADLRLGESPMGDRPDLLPLEARLVPDVRILGRSGAE